MSKNIVIIGLNYYPEDSAIGLYTTQKAEYLVEQGYSVSVISGFPYYPQWQIADNYKSKGWFLKETIDNIKVFRFKQYVPKKPSFFKRIVHLTSFTIGNFFNLFKVDKPDIVIAIVPFTTSVMLGWFLKLRYRSKLWVHIQDFEFDAAIDSGLLSDKKSVGIRFLLWIEKALLNKADRVSTISNGMLKKLKNKTNNNGYYLTNWLDTSAFSKVHNDNHEYLASSKYKILYSGNIGAKQDWDVFFKFLDELKKVEEIEVVVVGEGAKQEAVKKKLSDYSFVRHYNLVPFNELFQLLSSADLHILFQKDDVIDTVMPSKILGMMGSSRPSLITGNINSEVKQIIEASNGGFYFKNNQMKEIIKTVKTLQSNEKLSEDLGANAKQFIIENYSKEKVLNNFLKELNNI